MGKESSTERNVEHRREWPCRSWRRYHCSNHHVSSPIEHNNANGEHSVSGDLHGVQPDPVAADILRKEPEHETFVRLRISPFETPSSDEAEVYRALQGCLEMRKSYVFRESIAPWEKQVISDLSSPKRNPNPFDIIFKWKMAWFMFMQIKIASGDFLETGQSYSGS
ncbi:unnamed protein product [Lactuca virosa]|uniref:Uncharacterized protein n=1 Tax=Lactuca virosa TaxID=75947 RepID=A0AAU9NXZ3_9ASTR|nr:unnamed protein product [Lactuca virosa]